MINHESSDAKFANEMLAEARESRIKSTGPKPTATIMLGSFGILAMALLDIKTGKSTDWHEVRSAAIVIAALALRIAAEGDPVLGSVPNAENCR